MTCNSNSIGRPSEGIRHGILALSDPRRAALHTIEQEVTKLNNFSGEIEIWINRIMRWLSLAGVVPLFLMLFITFLDTIGTKIFLKPVTGAPEIVAALQVLAITCAAGFLHISGGHTGITFFVERLGRKSKMGLSIGVDILVLVLFFLLFWKCWDLGVSLQKAGEITSTAQIPLYPLAFFMCFCFALVSLAQVAQTFVKLAKKGESQ